MNGISRKLKGKKPSDFSLIIESPFDFLKILIQFLFIILWLCPQKKYDIFRND